MTALARGTAFAAWSALGLALGALCACQAEPATHEAAPADRPAASEAAPAAAPAATPSAEPEPPPVAEDFEAQAAAEVRADNYREALDALEREIGAAPGE